MAFVQFLDADNQPVTYTGNVVMSVSVSDGPAFAEFTRDDPYWNGQQVTTRSNTYRRGARLNRSGGTPQYGTTITIPVTGQTGTYAGLAIYSFGTVTVSATAAGKSASDAVSDIWIQGRATTYADDADPHPDGPYICAIPYASQSQNLYNSSCTVRNMAATQIQCDISWPGPMVPISPYYPPNDTSWNHYWNQAGWPPLAVSMSGKTRARRRADGTDYGDYTFNNQIIDLDTLTKRGQGRSAASILGISGSGTVQWQF